MVFGAAFALTAALVGAQDLLALPGPAPAPPVAEQTGAVAGKAVQLTKVVMNPPTGSIYVAVQQGVFCTGGRSYAWTSGASPQRLPAFLTVFDEAMTRAGVKTQGDPGDLFEQAADEGASAEFSIGALITDVKVRACQPQITGPNSAAVRGEATMTVEWQIFSRLTRQVVAKITTQGMFTEPNAVTGGLVIMNLGAFRVAAERLGESADYRRAVSGSALGQGQVLRPSAAPPPIGLSGALSATRRSLDDESSAVVVIYAGEGMGSGFLVSDDGYILTDSHVVKDARQVRLRWSDGREALGEVVRTDRARGVALIRADPQGRRPLPLRRDLPAAGETVFAIGAPFGRAFQGTVTRGVVSAKRAMEGFTYLQSDIAVNPGSGGGPLTDESGRVVALARSSVRLGAAPTGIALFIPVGDAEDVLGLQPR